MSVKDILLSKLSYTNQDYESILLEIANLFNGGELGTSWNNISESDIMFIMMSLIAAHKDMLNYMLDYRILETFMSTAREIRSVIRNASSFGYKVGSYKAASASAEVASTVTDVEITSYTQFTDSNGIPWTYIDEDTTVSEGDTLRLYQGTPRSIQISLSGVSSDTKTHIISNQSVAIGSNYSDQGCSKLVVSKETEPDSDWEEISNIYTYTDSDTRVYELNVDTQGITYIGFLKDLDLSQYDGYTFTLNYLLTQGVSPTSINNLTGYATSEGSSVNISLEPVSGSFVAGANPPDISEIREGFKRYYASANSLITPEDYKNFLLYTQKTVLGISKCLVADNQRDTIDTEGNPALADGEVGIYALKEDNATLTPTEVSDLEELILKYRVSGITVTFDDPVEEAISLEFNILPTADPAGFKSMISDYINSKGIGESLTSTELYSLIANSGYSSVYKNGISITMIDSLAGSYTTELTVPINGYITCDVADISAA